MKRITKNVIKVEKIELYEAVNPNGVFAISCEKPNAVHRLFPLIYLVSRTTAECSTQISKKGKNRIVQNQRLNRQRQEMPLSLEIRRTGSFRFSSADIAGKKLSQLTRYWQEVWCKNKSYGTARGKKEDVTRWSLIGGNCWRSFQGRVFLRCLATDGLNAKNHSINDVRQCFGKFGFKFLILSRKSTSRLAERRREGERERMREWRGGWSVENNH